MHFAGHFERRFDCRIQYLRTDGGGEYANVDLFCQKAGIARQKTEADNPASNGKAERMHRTVLNMARCMIFNCRLPVYFWGDAVKYAAYILNRSPCRSNPRRMSPIEMLEGKPPNLANIVAFGSPCMVYRNPGKNALRKRSQRGLILGMSEEVKGYTVWLREANKVITTQHVKNIETLSRAQNVSLFANDANTEGDLHQSTDQITGVGNSSMGGASAHLPSNASSTTEPSKAKTRSADQRKPSRRIRDMMTAYVKELEELEELDEDSTAGCHNVEAIKDPKNYAAAMKTPQAEQWKASIEKELQSLRDNRTWVVIMLELITS